MRKNYWLFILILIPLYSIGQTSRVSEEEVMIQKLFIEASKEKVLGNYETSASLYREVLGKNPNNDAAAYELSRVYDVMDQDKEALQSINLAVAVNPVNSWYQIFKSDILEKQRDYVNAALVYEDLIKYYPNEDYYYYKQAYYLVLGKEVNKAIKVYNLLEKNIGITADLTKKKFNLYLGIDNQKKATQELTKLVKAYPSDIDYRLDLAQFYMQTNRQDQGKKEFEQILKLDPNNGEATIMLASNGKTPKGGNSASKLTPIFENPETNIDLKIKELIPMIQKVADTGDKNLANEAISLAQILENTHPNEAKAFSAYGDLLYYSGNITAAKAKYQKALELDKSVYSIWEQLLYIFESEKDYKELVKTSKDAQIYFPNQAKTYYFKGIGEYGLGNDEKAEKDFKRTLIMTRQNPLIQFDTHHRLLLVNKNLRKWDAAKTNFEKASAIKADHPGLLSSYAWALASEGKDIEKALSLVKKADEATPKNMRIQRIYAQVLMAQGDLDKSKNWLDLAIANGGEKNSEVLEAYGDLMFANKDLNQAKSYWQKAIDLGGNAIRLKKKIENPPTAN